MEEKDLYLLGRLESPARQDSLPERIEKLRQEIAKGENLYTADELQILKGKLEECEYSLRILMNP